MLNKLGSNIDPCGTPKRISPQELFELFVLVYGWENNN